MNKDTFEQELKKINIELNEIQIKQLEKYYEILVEENKKNNLTRIIDKEEVYLKHFYDSLTLIKSIDLGKKIKICDVGSGAGFPGIVLKIAFPNLDMVLIDSLNKRILFLNKIIKSLNLKNICAIHERMENFSKQNKEVFDVITSRAVARSEILVEICSQALKINGHLLLMKANCLEEINNTKKIISKYNIKINNIIEFSLPIENSKRTLVDFIKENKTPDIYPRNIRIIKKENLL